MSEADDTSGVKLFPPVITLVANSAWPVLMAVPVMLLLRNAIILMEERYLEAKFGQAYADYKAHVRRWI